MRAKHRQRLDRPRSGDGTDRALLAPARPERMRNRELVEHARHDKVDEVGDRARAIVEAGRWRKDHRSRTGEPQQVVEVNCGERRLARDQHQRTPGTTKVIGAAMLRLRNCIAATAAVDNRVTPAWARQRVRFYPALCLQVCRRL